MNNRGLGDILKPLGNDWDVLLKDEFNKDYSFLRKHNLVSKSL